MVGSRTPSSAPRRVAGRPARPGEAHSPPQSPDPVEHLTLPEKPAVRGSETPKQPRRTSPAPTGGVLAQQRTTTVLAAVLALLVVALGCLVFLYFRDGEAGAAGVWRHELGEEFQPPGASEHPVAVNSIEWRNATEASTRAVTDILTVDWKTYDDHLTAVKKRMTPAFAEEYDLTAADSREKFLQSKADYDFVVVGQSVVSATEDEVTSLLFLNQYVYKGEGKDRVGPDIYQVRVVVTTVHDGDEWLVDELDAL